MKSIRFLELQGKFKETGPARIDPTSVLLSVNFPFAFLRIGERKQNLLLTFQHTLGKS